VQAFEVSAVRHLNHAFRRGGQLFDDRYHSDLIESPTQARHAIAYVLGNWRHHGHDTGLLRAGWRKAGTISMAHVPGP
jgi:hypothetical protein